MVVRTVVDRFVSWLALVVAAVLVFAGGLLGWAHDFIGDQVRSQLSQQQITMPGGQALTTATMKKELGKYSGQQMTTGPQAKAYANYFIGSHLKEMGGGKTYAQVSAEQMAAAAKNPTSSQAQRLGDLKQEMFQGNTLRGLLLYGYAFATMGTIAGIAAIAAFVGRGPPNIAGAPWALARATLTGHLRPSATHTRRGLSVVYAPGIRREAASTFVSIPAIQDAWAVSPARVSRKRLMTAASRRRPASVRCPTAERSVAGSSLARTAAARSTGPSAARS